MLAVEQFHADLSNVEENAFLLRSTEDTLFNCLSDFYGIQVYDDFLNRSYCT